MASTPRSRLAHSNGRPCWSNCRIAFSICRKCPQKDAKKNNRQFNLVVVTYVVSELQRRLFSVFFCVFCVFLRPFFLPGVPCLTLRSPLSATVFATAAIPPCSSSSKPPSSRARKSVAATPIGGCSARTRDCTRFTL